MTTQQFSLHKNKAVQENVHEMHFYKKRTSFGQILETKLAYPGVKGLTVCVAGKEEGR